MIETVFTIKYFFINRGDICDGCKMPKSGDHAEKNLKEWNSEECTIFTPTDAYGTINFPGFRPKKAQVKLKLIFL